ncbi:MAG: glycosyltransferase family 4 protein, partial [Planctomycetota bacterium]
KPDLVYVHGLIPVFSGWLVSRLFKARLAIRVYGVRDLYWKWSDIFYRIKELRSYAAFKIPVDCFIITNDGTGGCDLAKKLGVCEDRIRNWRNGIDPDLYAQDLSAKEYVCDYLKLAPSCKIIASTCRLIPIYGVNRLLRASVDLHKDNPEAVLLVAGDGPERQKLEALAEKAGISSRVFFLGVVDRQMVKKILYASDIFVLLADYHNCTNTMWEAMACGKCIVTTETEAIKEILTSEKDAVLVPRDRLDSTAAILQGLLDNDDLRERLGDNARRRAKEILEPWSKRMEKESQLLEDVAKNIR